MINDKNFNIGHPRPRVLIAPLDWGLGHATRCIPIINELIKQDCEVIIAADKGPFFLLKKEFPGTVFLRIKGYNIQYSGNKKWLFIKLLWQFPKIVFYIRKENIWLKKMVTQYHIDAIISDNRFGLYHKEIPSVYITHQLHIKTGNSISEKVAQKLHYHFIKKYDHCWIPDSKEDDLAGELSSGGKTPSNVLYIGPLSRFKKIDVDRKIYDVLISLSGPEPQRTLLENRILPQLKTFKKKVLLVRGLPGDTKELQGDTASIKIMNHLSAEDLNIAFEQAELIISRSGYSTIMDLVKLGKKAILIPTPGQTEQEYLSKYLMEKKYFYSVLQSDLNLETAIEQASSFAFTVPATSFDSYKKIITGFVLSLKTGNFAPQ